MPVLAWKHVYAPTRPSATRDRHPALFFQTASPSLELFYPTVSQPLSRLPEGWIRSTDLTRRKQSHSIEEYLS
jgi:hypothetical protein